MSLAYSLSCAIINFISVQSLSHVQLFVTPWTAARQASLSITNSQSSPKSTSIESVIPSIHLILCCPLFLLPSIFPSIRVFSNESALRIRWPKYWSFSFNISPSNEHPGLISLIFINLQRNPTPIGSHFTPSINPYCCSSVAMPCLTHYDPMDCSMQGSPVFHYFLKFAQIHVHWVWCHLTASSSATLCYSCLQSFPGSGSFSMTQLFASVGQNIGASASVLPLNFQTSFRIDWLDPLAVQGILKSLFQHYSLNIFLSLLSMYSEHFIYMDW